MSDDPYGMDFLETIVNVHFNSEVGYVLLSISAVTSLNGTVMPPCPVVTFDIGKGAKLVDRQESCTHKLIPAKPIVEKLFFIWSTIAPFPTATNFGNIVGHVPGGQIPDLGYGAQFSQFIQINFAQFAPPIFAGQSQAGVYTSLSRAQAAAAALNASVFTGHPGGSTMGFWPADGSGLIQHAGLIQPPFAAELDIKTTSPASAQSTLTGTYLFSVPFDLAHVKPTVTVGPGTSTIKAAGFSDITLKTAAAATHATPDTIANGASTTTGTYDVTSVVGPGDKPKAHKNTVTVTGGHTGGAS